MEEEERSSRGKVQNEKKKQLSMESWRMFLFKGERWKRSPQRDREGPPFISFSHSFGQQVFTGYLSWAGCGHQGGGERNVVPYRAYDEVGAQKGAERRGIKKSRV